MSGSTGQKLGQIANGAVQAGRDPAASLFKALQGRGGPNVDTQQSPIMIAPGQTLSRPTMGALDSYRPTSASDPARSMQFAPPPSVSDVNSTLPAAYGVQPVRQGPNPLTALTSPPQGAGGMQGGGGGSSLAAQGASGAAQAMQAAQQGQVYAPAPLQMGGGSIDPSKLVKIAKMLFV